MRFPNLGKVQPMSKKIERVFREGRLSAEEVARDEEVRRKVQAEFPPAAPSGSGYDRNVIELVERPTAWLWSSSRYDSGRDACHPRWIRCRVWMPELVGG